MATLPEAALLHERRRYRVVLGTGETGQDVWMVVEEIKAQGGQYVVADASRRVAALAARHA